jgi:RimJ/RimL family protein N-acetyltransferase
VVGVGHFARLRCSVRSNQKRFQISIRFAARVSREALGRQSKVEQMENGMHLRAFSRLDFQRLIDWIDSPELLIQWAGPTQFAFPLSTEQLEVYLSGSDGTTPRHLIYTATTAFDEARGHIELGAIDHVNRTCSICRVLVAPSYRGKGLSQPMVREALRIGFEDMDLRRIELKVYSFNSAAIRCYEQAGFVREGVLRKAIKVNDAYWDTVLMAILREDWLPPSGMK